jgi:5-formyltetrahydrofolate cyclo-ligase
MQGKRITRRTIRIRRDALTDDARMSASDRIADEVMTHLDAVAPGQIVALYASTGTEVDTARIDQLVRARGLRVVYPRVVDGERRLSFHEVAREDLVTAHFGIREPKAEAPSIDLATIAAFVIPGLAFDRRGGRVGWGRGYYDATLAVSPQALRIGLAFEIQLVDEVPSDPHDENLHVVVTEAAHYLAPRD